MGRARHAGDLVVAKVLPSKQAAYIAYNMQEIFVNNYEVLVGDGFQWVGSGNGHTPDNAVVAGHTSSGEALFIGRGKKRTILSRFHYKNIFDSISRGKFNSWQDPQIPWMSLHSI